MITEINSPHVYEMTGLVHEMGRAARMSFYVIGENPDTTSPTFDVQDEVRFTVGGVCWFYGRVLPARKVIRAGEEVLEYIAADPLEWLGNNFCFNNGAGVSEWYNRNVVDVAAYDWPSDKTVEQILTAELASIVGAGLLINALDFTRAGNPRLVKPAEFQTKGKTWLGIIEALVNESPGLGYWYDPSTCIALSPPTGMATYGTLRFYDLSTVGLSATRKDIVVKARSLTYEGVAANAEDIEINEDFSASYDTLRVRGLGAMTERYEQASASFSSLSGSAYGNSGPFLRHNTTTGKTEAFQPSVLGGQWVDESTLGVRPWFPESTAPGYKTVGRRFAVTHPIMDLRITRKDGTSPAVYTRDVQSMWAFTLQSVWYAGKLAWWEGDTLWTAQLQADLKYGQFSGGDVDDDGDVKYNVEAYGDPVTTTQPRFGLPTPTAYDSANGVGYVLLKEPLMRRTQYLWTGTSDPDYANIVGVPCFKYWPTYDYCWLKYTSADPLEVSQTDGALGYNKTMILYDQRLMKYTNIDGLTIKDDTSKMTAITTAIFDFVKRRRIYGRATLHTTSAGVFTNWPMGSLVRLVNWGGDGTNYSPPAFIQSIDLSKLLYEERLGISFDRNNTFMPLERYLEGHEFYEGDTEQTRSGLEGRRGNRANPGDKKDTKKPKDDGGSGSVQSAFNTTSVADDPVPVNMVIKGKITSRTEIRGKANTIMYKASAFGIYNSDEFQVPKLRTCTPNAILRAAAIDSDCLVQVTPKSNNSGYTCTILAVAETIAEFWIPGVITAAPSSDAKPNLIFYDVRSTDGGYAAGGEWVLNGVQPIYRPYNDNPMVTPAAVDSVCQMLIQETSSGSPPTYSYEAFLYSCAEKLAFESCTPEDFDFLTGDQLLSESSYLVGSNSQDIVSADGNLVRGNTDEDYPVGTPEDHIVIGSDYRICFDADGNAVLADNDNVIQPTYFDDILVSSYQYIASVTTINGITPLALGAQPIPVAPTGID